MAGFGDTAASLARSPLGIIALFLVLVYSIACLIFGVRTNLTDINVLLFTLFVVLYPVIVLLVFYRLVTNHYTKLYSPKDYPEGGGFLEAMKMTLAGQQTQQVKGEIGGDIEKIVKEIELTESLKSAKQQWEIWYKYWYFERIWNSIYRSQIELLEHLNSKPGGTDTLNNLYNKFYAEYVKVFPGLSSYPYQSYMNYLTSQGLLRSLGGDPSNPSFEITPLGKEFLTYLSQYGYKKLDKVY